MTALQKGHDSRIKMAFYVSMVIRTEGRARNVILTFDIKTIIIFQAVKVEKLQRNHA